MSGPEGRESYYVAMYARREMQENRALYREWEKVGIQKVSSITRWWAHHHAGTEGNRVDDANTPSGDIGLHSLEPARLPSVGAASNRCLQRRIQHAQHASVETIMLCVVCDPPEHVADGDRSVLGSTAPGGLV